MMWNVELAAIAGAGVGALITYALGRTYCQNVREDRHIDAYEKGWADGYQSGGQYTKKDVKDAYDQGYTDCMNDELDTPPVKKPAKRVKKIRKAEP